MMQVSMRDTIRNTQLRIKIMITSAIGFIEKQQVDWFGHFTRQ